MSFYAITISISIFQVLLLHFTKTSFSSDETSAGNTVHFVLLVHSVVSAALAVMSWRNRAVTPNMIGLALYTMAASWSLNFIGQQHSGSEKFDILSKMLIFLGTFQFGICWISVYRERFQGFWSEK